MPDTDISSGSKAKIISRREASLLEDSEEDADHFIVDVTGDDIRLAVGDTKDQIRHGFPVPAGSTFTVDPLGNEIWAYGDGAGTSTVNVQLMKYRIGEIG